MHAHLAPRVAGRMQRHGAGLTPVRVAEVHDMHQKLAELVDAIGQIHRLGVQHGIVGKQHRVVPTHHAAAGTRWNDDGPGFGEQVQLLQRNGPCLLRKAAAVRRLAAAGLLLGKVNRDSFTLQQLNGVESGLRTELVNQTGGEQINVGRFGRVVARMPGIEAHAVCLRLDNW